MSAGVRNKFIYGYAVEFLHYRLFRNIVYADDTQYKFTSQLFIIQIVVYKEIFYRKRIVFTVKTIDNAPLKVV